MRWGSIPKRSGPLPLGKLCRVGRSGHGVAGRVRDRISSVAQCRRRIGWSFPPFPICLAGALHLETFYRAQVNPKISVTPGLLIIFNLNHNKTNDTISIQAMPVQRTVTVPAGLAPIATGQPISPIAPSPSSPNAPIINPIVTPTTLVFSNSQTFDLNHVLLESQPNRPAIGPTSRILLR